MYYLVEDLQPKSNLHRVMIFDCLDKALDFFCESSNRDELDVWPLDEDGEQFLSETPHVVIQ